MGDLFRRSTPEKEGISSVSVLDAVKRLQKQKIAMHSFLLARHGNLVFEGYWKPYGPDSLQRMYSITKSFTSLAIGYLEKEKKISLDDKIIKYFPEKYKNPVFPETAEITIREMLSMRTVHDISAYRKVAEGDWVKSFFTASPDHDSGTFFRYDTSATHVLAALVKKVSSEDLFDYIKNVVLPEVPFSPGARILKDSNGDSLGGSGLLCTSEDLLNTMIYLTSGKWKCNDYLRMAVTPSVSTLDGFQENISALHNGYGYCFWALKDGGWCMYGMGGQLALYLPEKEIIAITTGFSLETAGYLQAIINEIYDIADSASYGAIEENESSILLKKINLELPVLEPDFPAEGIVSGTYVFPSGKTGIHKVELSESKVVIELENGTAGTFVYTPGKNTIQNFAFNSEWKAAVSAVNSKKDLVLYIQLLFPELGTMFIRFSPKNDRMTVNIRYCIDSVLSVGQGSISGGCL